jgi:hypothetical protein
VRDSLEPAGQLQLFLPLLRVEYAPVSASISRHKVENLSAVTAADSFALREGYALNRIVTQVTDTVFG